MIVLLNKLLRGKDYTVFIFFVHAQIPVILGLETYLYPSFPIFVIPQHSFAGYGGPGRDAYFCVVFLTHFLLPLIAVRLFTLFQYPRILAYILRLRVDF